jgi:plastocyanin
MCRWLPADKPFVKSFPIIAGLLVALVAPICASDIDGSIRIERKLTHRTVTAPVSAYQRGQGGDLGSDSQEDPLSFERSHVVVYLEGKGLPSSPATAALEQRDRRFAPDLVVVAAGSMVRFPNRDVIFHNVFSLAKAKIFDLGNYPKDQTRSVVFPRPGIVFVNCRLHSNMTATIVLAPNGYATRANEAGKFTFSNLAAGTYTVVAWHKSAGFFKKVVTVDGNGNAAVEFFIPLPKVAMDADRQEK